jgi:hypothetical protein
VHTGSHWKPLTAVLQIGGRGKHGDFRELGGMGSTARRPLGPILGFSEGLTDVSAMALGLFDGLVCQSGWMCLWWGMQVRIRAPRRSPGGWSCRFKSRVGFWQIVAKLRSDGVGRGSHEVLWLCFRGGDAGLD